MCYRKLLFMAVLASCSEVSLGQWLDMSNLNVTLEPSKMGGPRIVVEYDLENPRISPDAPAYVFVRYSKDSGETWALLPASTLRGNGFDLVEKPGRKQVIWWGVDQAGVSDLGQVVVCVRGIQMRRIPEGQFIRQSLPGQGRDESGAEKQARNSAHLPLFYMARCETTIAMYVDYLNEVGYEGAGWNSRMTHEDRCGITRSDDFQYSIKPGRDTYPVTYVSWYDAVSFLGWCGLDLPTEAQWEKALRGGVFLDGDTHKIQPNPLPARRFPWGDALPDAGGVYRCNFDGPGDGFEYTAPVGSFGKFNSPHGLCDLAGNLAEWTLDWYSTSFHVGLDGFRVVRGGSWMSVPAGCDAVTGATQLPLKESSIMGFRGVK
ncbi:MAG: formylglycine-generating enzyme family protein [Planctomycetes bacterium]|nr:formylglycine-generating enzyme family protein [Planctomycetota bacterium]